MANVGPLAADIDSGVWSTPANFNVSRLGSVTAKLCGVEQRVPPIFDRAAVTLGIGPHSS